MATESVDFQPRVLSGIQPSGRLHLGNYFGAVRQHVALQTPYRGDAYYFIADYHALTTTRDSSLLQRRVLDLAMDYLALGLDPSAAVLYRQSDVPEVCELTWILACVTPKGLLDRAHAYKDKRQAGLTASVGLFLYPELMAADILLPRATVVPVGRDQVQHLEIARDIGAAFNSAFEYPLFPLPEARLDRAPVVCGTDGRKMSKSYGNAIPVFQALTALRESVNSIQTAPVPLGSPVDPRDDTILSLLSLVASEDDVGNLREAYVAGAIGYGAAKQLLTDRVWEFFSEARERRGHLERAPGQVEEILAAGAETVRCLAAETLDHVRSLVGIGERSGRFARTASAPNAYAFSSWLVDRSADAIFRESNRRDGTATD